MKFWLSGVFDGLRTNSIDGMAARRQVPFVAATLMFIALFAPVMALRSVARSVIVHAMPSIATLIDVLLSIAMAIGSWICVRRMSRHAYRPALRLFLGIALASTFLRYAAEGTDVLEDGLIPYVILGFAVQTIGRRALWTSCWVLLVAMSGGVASDIFVHAIDVGTSCQRWLLSTCGVICAAAILDRIVVAARKVRWVPVDQRRTIARQSMQLDIAKSELAHAQKLEMAGRIAASVAHDIDNLLAVIIGYAARRERLADSGMHAVMKAMEGIESAAYRAAHVSGKLLGFCRRDANQPEVFDARDAVRSVRPMVEQLFGAMIKLDIRMPDTPLLIRFDRIQFEFILLNLALNARDAMPHGGAFDIHIRHAYTEPSMVMALSDTGFGIHARDLVHIFESFFTTKPPGRGTGLGLSAVKELVQEADGHVHAHSILGQGTTFQITLPTVQQVRSAT